MSKVYSNDLVGVRESVVDEFLLLNAHQTPLLNLIGFSEAVTNVEHVWFEDELFAYESTLAGAVADGTASAIEVADAEPFRVGHVVKVGEELMLVTGITGTSVSVERGYADTTASAQTAGTKVEVLFTEGDEGQDARNARYKARKRVSNLTQIIDDTVELSGTAMAVNQFGVDDEYDKERVKKQIEMALQLEKALINGVKFENGTKRLMRGVRQFISTNVSNASGEVVSDDILNDALQAIYEKGGFKQGANYKIMVGAKQKRALAKQLDAEKVRIDRLDNGRGMVVDHYISDFGSAEIILNNNLAPDEILIVDINRMAIRPLQGRDFGHEYLGKQGDYMRGMLLGEYTLEFKQEGAHARIKGLA